MKLCEAVATEQSKIDESERSAARESTLNEREQNKVVRLPVREKVFRDVVLNNILEKLKPVDFRAIANLGSNENLAQKHLIVLCIEELLRVVRENNFDLARKHDFLFGYNGAMWKQLDYETLKAFLGESAERMGIDALDARHYEFREKLYKQFIVTAQFEAIEPGEGVVLVNLANGTFEITSHSQKLREFCPSDFLTYQLPFAFDEKADAPLFHSYLNRALPEKELRDLLAEYIAYVFTRNLKLEKALLLYGSGANGKSVFFDVINALLGKENVTNYALADLMQEHNRAQIANKLLNYASEINAGVTKDNFKTLCSGEPIQARLKYGNAFIMDNYAKLAFNCNELPRDIESSSEAYFRRLIIIPFRVTIPEREQDAELARKIIKEELSGVFNWVLEGLKRLLTNKHFTHSDIVKSEVETYKRESDSVCLFVDESDYEPSLNDYEYLATLYESYRAFCQTDGYKAVSNKNFAKRLEKLGFETEKKRSGKVVYIQEKVFVEESQSSQSSRQSAECDGSDGNDAQEKTFFQTNEDKARFEF